MKNAFIVAVRTGCPRVGRARHPAWANGYEFFSVDRGSR